MLLLRQCEQLPTCKILLSQCLDILCRTIR